MNHSDYIEAAVRLSAEALTVDGAEPFGAVVVKDGEIVGRGVNRSRATLDPTSHGETEAIRDACRNLGTTDLSGATLYTSCEPCPLCVAAMALAGIDALYFAARLSDSRAILGAVPSRIRRPSAIERLRELCGTPVEEGAMAGQHIASPAALEVLHQWAAQKAG